MAVVTWILIGLVVVVAVLFLLFLRWVFTLREVVQPNEVHIVRQGKKTVEYGANTGAGNSYYRWPEWVPVWGVTVATLPLSVFDVDIKGYDAYDKDRLPFVVDVKAFFRINNYKVAAERVQNFVELRNQLLDICRGAARTILAKEDLESIMGERSKYGQIFTDEVKGQLEAWGVEPVKSIELMDIRDADGERVIANIMKKKKSAIEKESRVTVARNEQEAREAEILAKQEVDLKQAAADQTVGMRQAEVDREVGIAQQKSDQAVQDEKKTTKEKEMSVLQVEVVRKAEIEKDQTLVNAEAARQKAEIDKKTTIVDAEAARQKVELEAQAGKVKTELQAEADLTKATKNAEGIAAEGRAKAEAEEKMQLASVTAQTTLAAKVGENKPYQEYLIAIRQVEANEKVGVAQAENISGSNIRIISGADGIQGGLNKALDLFSPKGGASLSVALEAFAGTEAGQAFLSAIKGLVAGKEDQK